MCVKGVNKSNHPIQNPSINLCDERMSLSFAITAVLASAVILESESCGTHDHILLSQIRDSTNLEGQVPVFMSPRNRVAQLYPQALGSLFIASYDSCRNTLEVFETASKMVSVWFSEIRYYMQLLYIVSKLVLGPNRPPIQWVPGALSPGIKQSGREVDQIVTRTRLRGPIHPLPYTSSWRSP
jgi:hypothetical protein